MKKDLTTAIIVAIIGVVAGFLVCNLFITKPEDVKVTTIDSSKVSTSVTDPSEEIFNVRALNPTVEVYVGDK